MSDHQRKWDIRWLRVAREISSWSKDPSSQIGCVAVQNNRMIAHGYNGFPSQIEDREDWLNDRETKLSLTVHAEMNMISDATRSGRPLEGSTAYVYGLPICSKCMIHLINARIQRFVMVSRRFDKRWEDEWKISTSILDKAGVEDSQIVVYNFSDL